MKRKSESSANLPAKKALSFADLSDGSDLSGQSDHSDMSDMSDQEGTSDQDQDQDQKPAQSGRKMARIQAEDVRIARETSELFKSNIFKLQIDALLEEIAVPEKYLSMANKLLYSLRDAILAAHPTKEYSCQSVGNAFPNKIPFPQPLDLDSRTKFKFEPPQDVNVVGSYSLKSTVKQPEPTDIDLVVVIPGSTFEHKDYLNFRYFQKRAFYLAAIANTLANASIDVKARYDLLNGDPLRPILRLEPNNHKLARYYNIKIHLGLEPHVFPARKLASDRNAVREIEVPTPMYNFAVLNDLAYQPILNYLHTASAQCAEFTNACKLARLWLRQRGLHFRHLHFALLMAALLNGGPAGKRVLLAGYSSYQLFRATLLYIASNDIDLAFNLNEPTTGAMSGTSTLELGELGLNILEDLPEWSLSSLKHEAKVAVELLQDVAVDRFQDLFLKNINNYSLKYDLSFTVSLAPTSDYQVVNGSYLNYITDRLYKTLGYACGSRVKQIVFKSRHESSWPLSSLPQLDTFSELVIDVGIILDVEESEKRVTYGPAPNEPGQKQFKEFWDGKSSLRRFQDGKIMEAVVWKPSSRSIVYDIAQFVVHKHFDGSIEAPPSVDMLLPFQKHIHERNPTSLALWQTKINTFHDLARRMMEMKLPLRISSVYGISSSLRYTSIVEPLANDQTCEDNIAEAIIQLESSGRWPDDAAAIEKTKTAFLIQIAQVVRKTAKFDAIVGVEPSLAAGELESGFMVVQADGFAFKFRIATERDSLVYAKTLKEQGQVGEQTLLKFNRVGPAAADHHRLVSGMALKYAFYSPTVRVLKIWFKKHMLASHITEEAIELLALKPFIDSSPYTPPSSVSSAFYRILDFLATWNWKETPIIYDADRSKEELVQGCQMNATTYTKFMATFSSNRKSDPALTLSPYFIATRVDPTGVLWTQSLPRSRVGIMIASRTTALARNALGLVESGKVDAMFRPALQDFDVEIKLENPSVQSKSKFKNLAETDISSLVQSNQNIGLEFYRDIAGAFKDSLVLFYSGCFNDKSSKSQVITGIWNREAQQAQKFRVNLPYSVEPVNDGVKLNKKAIIEEINRLGDSMVSVVHF